MPAAEAATAAAAPTAASAPASAPAPDESTPDESTPIVVGAPAAFSYRSLEDGSDSNGNRRHAQALPDKQQQQNGAQLPSPSPSPSAGADSSVRQRRLPSAAGALESVARTSRADAGFEDDDGDDDDDGSSWAWLTRFIDKFGSVELDNKGSTARDHLALERTFLAWLRTSLSFAGIGIAITQLFRLNTAISTPRSPSSPPPSARSPDHHTHGFQDLSFPVYVPESEAESVHSVATSSRLRTIGKPLGASFLGLAILILLLGWRRYIESQHFIIRGRFPASRGSIGIVTVAAGTLVITTFVIVLVVDPSMLTSG